MSLTQTWCEVGELAAGQHLTVPVYHFKGANPTAPKVYVQANVHGAEVQGNAVIFQLMKQLEELNIQGDITLVPLANPLGINQKSGEFTLGRFDPITGVNWNREYLAANFNIEAWFLANRELSDVVLFERFREELIENCVSKLSEPWGLSSGKRLAVTLQKMAHEADIILDLHTGPKSCKHLYCPKYALDAAHYFSIPHTLVMPNDFDGAMDEACFTPWWQLVDIASSHGRELSIPTVAFTLELGSQERIDLEDALIDAEGILAYLSHRGVILDDIKPLEMQRVACQLKDYRKLYAPISGLVEYLVPLGEAVSKQEAVARLLRLDMYGTQDELTHVFAPLECIPILHFASASVHQGTELYKVMTNIFEL